MEFLKKLLAKAGQNVENQYDKTGVATDQLLDRVRKKMHPEQAGPELPVMTEQEQAQLEGMTPAMGRVGIVNEAKPIAQPILEAAKKQVTSLPELIKQRTAAITPEVLEEAKSAMNNAKDMKSLRFAQQRYSRLLDLFDRNKK